MIDAIPVVLIGVESDEKGGQSPEHQLHELRQHPPVHESGRFVIGEFKESGYSGFKRERGPETQRGLDTAKSAAAEYGQAEVWFFHSSRAARGDGKKGKRSLLSLYADLYADDVQLRTKEDDEFVSRPMLVGIASEQNHKYSRDLSTHVSRGKRQQRAEGARSGGPLPDGFLYKSRKPHPLNERRMICEFMRDPKREHIYRAMFDGMRAGHSESKIAQDLNAKGYRTKAWVTKKGGAHGGNRFNFRSVKHSLSNPFYYGGNGWNVGKADEEIFWHDRPAYGTREDFDAYRQRRAEKGGKSNNPTGAGRPSERYLLGSGFARCGRCGGKVSTRTHSNKRVTKGGTQKRSYVCLNCKYGNGECDLPHLDAERIDAELVAHLDRVWIDFEAFVGKINAAQSSEAEKVERERDDAAAKLATAEAADRKLRERYAAKVAEDDDGAASIILQTLTENAATTEEAAKRVQGLSDRLAEVVATTPVDESLDALSALRDELRDTLGKSSVREVREGLERRFVTFVLDRDDDGRDTVTPILKRLPVYASWGQPLEGEEIPTHALVSIDPAQKGSDSWESLHAVPD